MAQQKAAPCGHFFLRSLFHLTGAQTEMMTLTMGLLAVAAFFLWWRKASWGWAAVMIALVIGIVIIMGDVDFSSHLGVQL